MGMGKNLIIFCFVFAFVLWILSGGYIQTPALEMVTCMSDPGNPINVTSPNSNLTTTSGVCTLSVAGATLPISLYTAILAVLVFLVGTSLITAVFGRFPDPYSWFATAGIFLLAFITFPITLINQSAPFMPAELRLLIGGIFVISYLISFFEFYKGGAL